MQISYLSRRIAFWILIIPALASYAGTLTGYVVGISDGDTLTVLDASHKQYKIRLAGIDAPEKAQPFGDRSKQSLAAMAFNKNVTVEWNKLDRYGRTVGKVVVNGKDANLEQVRTGMAWWYRDYAKEQSPADRGLYEQAEINAKARHVGLWSDKEPIPPWDFRHGTGEAAAAPKPAAVGACPCDGPTSCTGPRGGHYCISSSGAKRYR
jgi:endonuclease YncB( thermonuclease family)